MQCQIWDTKIRYQTKSFETEIFDLHNSRTDMEEGEQVTVSD